MHAVVRNYSAPKAVIEEGSAELAQLEETMRGTPGFVAYYFLETDDGITTITVTEDDAGTAESMGRAATWVEQNLLETRALLTAPEVTRGEALLAATR